MKELVYEFYTEKAHKGNPMKRARIAFTALVLTSTVPALASLSAETIRRTSSQMLVFAQQTLGDIKTLIPASQQSACSDYAVGETRRLQSMQAQYLMTKTGDKTYIASMNLQYVADDVSDAQAQGVRHQVEQCYKDAGFLADPTGQKLKFNLLDPSSSQAKQLRAKTIKVHQRMHREDSGDYSLSMNCPMILHESLHLLGLWDEYKERESDMRCRALGDSIMADQEQVDLPDLAEAERSEPSSRPEPQAYFPDHKDYFVSHASNYFYPAQGLYCRSIGRKGDNLFLDYSTAGQGKGYQLESFITGVGEVYDRVPFLYVPNSKDFGKNVAVTMPPDWMTDYIHLDPKKWRCVVNKFDMGATVKAGSELLKMLNSPDKSDAGAQIQTNTPLRPAHFRKFLNPNCRAKNIVYDTCTSEAYLVPSPGHQCVTEKNPICASPNWLN